MLNVPDSSNPGFRSSIYGVGIGIRPSPGFPLAQVATRFDFEQIHMGKLAGAGYVALSALISQLPAPVRSTLESICFQQSSQDESDGDVSDIDSNSSTGSNEPNVVLPDAILKRVLAVILCSLGYASMNVKSSLYVLVRAMFAARLFTLVSSLSARQTTDPSRLSAKQPGVGPSASVLKVENGALRQELEDAKQDALRLKKDKLDLQDKLRRCLAMKEEATQEVSRLSDMARLQNQSLESRIFITDEPHQGEDEDNMAGNHYDVGDDSIIIITDVDGVDSEPIGHHDSTDKLCVKEARPNLATPQKVERIEPAPIPVHITERPSLPPKVTKRSLKPLLLAARFVTSGSSKRLAKRASNRSLRGQASSSSTEIASSLCREDSSDVQGRKLNPFAPAFAPRTQSQVSMGSPTVEPTFSAGSGCVQPTIITTAPTPIKPTFTSQAAESMSHSNNSLSPTFSPFVFSSPSPNSPFVRTPPLRRRSGSGSTFTFASTYDEPPLTLQPRAQNNMMESNNAPITPRTTRACSLKFIRVRAAERTERQRQAEQTSPIVKDWDRPSTENSPILNYGSPMIGQIGCGTVKGGKARLVGKGHPSSKMRPRTALGELTNEGRKKKVVKGDQAGKLHAEVAQSWRGSRITSA